MVNALIVTSCALALLAATASAAPYRNQRRPPASYDDDYSYGHKETYAPCENKHQKQTWYDSKGQQYGWDDKANKACLINWDSYNKHNKYEDKKDYGYDDKKDYGYDDKKDYGYDDKKDYGYDDKQDYGYDDEKDYGYDDQKDYGYDDKKDYGYQDDYSYDDDKSYGDDSYKKSTPSYFAAAANGGRWRNKHANYDNNDYHKKGGDSYGQCKKAKDHFYSTHSATLKQCVSIACAPGQSKEYISRALYQCAELESAARRNNHGQIPKGW